MQKVVKPAYAAKIAVDGLRAQPFVEQMIDITGQNHHLTVHFTPQIVNEHAADEIFYVILTINTGFWMKIEL